MRRHNGAALRTGLALLLLLYVASDDSSASDATECADTFLDGKENACSDYIANVDVSLGEVGGCALCRR